ncbi:hypothetical protein CBL_04473 [Carabus blaptoides fortunei]
MADTDNLEDLSLEELRKIHAECVKDLAMFKKDVALFRQANPGRLTMQEAMCQPQSSPAAGTAPPDSDKIEDKLLVRFLEMYTGVIVQQILLNTDTPNKNGDDYLEYNVKCSVDKINLELTYSSNAKLTANQLENIDELFEVKDLEIKVLQAKYALELQKTVEYFTANPSYLGAFFLCVQEYSKLFNTRRQVLRNLLADGEDYFDISLEDMTGACVIECSGRHTNTVFFVLMWCIVFDIGICSVRDSFKINLHEDSQLVDEVNPLFEKLCKKDTVLDEAEKLQLLKNVMKSVKAADVRLKDETAESTN